jgi:hypothetical protein
MTVGALSMSNETTFRALMENWQAAYDDLFATLKAMPPEFREMSGACGTWNPRQLAAHLAGWHYEAIRRYADITAGDPFQKRYEVDAYNALQVEARDHLTWEQTLADLREVIDILRMQALDVPEFRAAVEPRYGEWLVALADDAREHRAQIIAWLAEIAPADAS